MQIEISEPDLKRALAALHACCKSGGGSATWTTILNIARASGLSDYLGQEEHYELIGELAPVAIQEAVDSGVIKLA